MSSTQGQKLARDAYLTPRPVVEAAVRKLKDRYPDFRPNTCLEPGCAWGAHLDYVVDYFPTIVHSVGVDVTKQKLSPYHMFVGTDYITWKTNQRFDLIVTNPPFGIAEACFLKSKRLLTQNGLALMFERIGFYASKKRRQGLWRNINLREVWVCARRPAMVGQVGTDSCEYAYYLFDASLPGGVTRLDWLDW